MLDRAKLEHLQVEPPDLGVINPDRCRSEVADGVLRPPFAEFRADPGQLRRYRSESRVTGSLAGGGPELAQYRARGRLPADHTGTVLRVAEHHPQEIAPPGGEHRGVMPQPPVRLVPRDVVEMHVIDGGDVRGGRVDQPLHSGKHIVGVCPTRFDGETRQATEIPALVGVE